MWYKTIKRRRVKVNVCNCIFVLHIKLSFSFFRYFSLTNNYKTNNQQIYKLSSICIILYYWVQRWLVFFALNFFLFCKNFIKNIDVLSLMLELIIPRVSRAYLLSVRSFKSKNQGVGILEISDIDQRGRHRFFGSDLLFIRGVNQLFFNFLLFIRGEINFFFHFLLFRRGFYFTETNFFPLNSL